MRVVEKVVPCSLDGHVKLSGSERDAKAA